ncbi:MAG: S-layer homology domain-containing protein [Ruminiclostridium sp.]|nr:S-layer homology domain-containing protein [Ruminiclostridium sp.]
MKRRILAAALTLCLTMSLVPTAAFAVGGKSFDDVNGHWGQASVERWAGYGVFNGDDAGNFNPDKQMTRAEFATMLANMMGYTAKADKSFGDVASDAWYADAILKLAAAGVMLGDNNGNANPNKPISRAEAAVMMCRAFNIQPSNASLNFADSANVADWARGSMAALAEKGMMNGVGNNQLAPLANITRASVAKLVDNMISEYVTESKTISGDVKGIVLVVGDVDVTVKDATLSENLIVAPKAAGAEVVLTGSTKASDVYVDAAANVKVDAQATAGDVQLSAPKAAAEVAGKVDTVATTAAAADAAVTVAKDAAVSKVEVAAPNTNLNVAGKVDTVNVASSATGAEVKTESSAAISNVTTSATDVKVSGTGKVENVTANSGTVAVTTPGTKVENKTDSADNVTANGKPVPPATGGTTTPTKPSGSGGGGGGGTSYTYTVSIGTFEGGKITANKTQTNDKETITLTAEPNEGWKLVEVKVTAPGATVATPVTMTGNTGTFTLDAAGTYTVTATFTNPCGGVVAGMFDNLANVKTWLKENGVTATDEAIDSMLNTNFGTPSEPWLFIYLKKGTDAVSVVPGTALSFTVDGKTTAATWGQTTGQGNLFSVWVGGSHANQDVLPFDGSAGNIVVTANVGDVTYTSNVVEYVKQGVDADKLVSVTIDNGSGTPTTTKKLPEEKVPLIAPTVEDKYFTGWTVKVGATDATPIAAEVAEYTVPNDCTSAITITAQFVDITPAETTFRTPGHAKGTNEATEVQNFDYANEYKAAGLSYENSTITVNTAKLMSYIAAGTAKETTKDATSPTAAEKLGFISVNQGAKYVMCGIEFPAIANAKTADVTYQDGTNGAPNEIKDIDIPTDGVNAHNNSYIHYFALAKYDDNGVTFNPNLTRSFTVVYKDTNGKIIAVHTASITRTFDMSVPSSSDVITLTPTVNKINSQDDIRVDGDNSYICFQLKNTDALFPIQTGKISGAAKVKDNKLEMLTLWTTGETPPTAGTPALELPSADLTNSSNDYNHHVGLTLKQTDALRTVTYYFWDTAGKVYKAEINVPAKVASDDQKDESASGGDQTDDSKANTVTPEA